jgi:gamma-glutamyl-gamma-aminobutyrate hydrolase PuuD
MKKSFICAVVFIAVFVFTLPLFSDPVLLISHPYPSVVKNIIYLQKNKIMTKTDFLFLMHEKETSDRTKIITFMKKNRKWKYRILTVTGLPPARDYNQIINTEPGRFPLIKDNHFKVTRDRNFPGEWEKTFKKALLSSDGYLIPGGYDIPGSAYGSKQFLETYAGGALRSAYETAFIHYLLGRETNNLSLKPRYLILGICLGCQLLNVSTGGVMYQSIPLEIYNHYYVEDLLKNGHENMHKNYYLSIYPTVEDSYPGWFHKITMLKTGIKYFRYAENAYVLSNHHQAVKIPGYNFVRAGTSPDGKVTELFVHKVYPNVIGVQFHPEKEFCFTRLDNFPENSLAFHKNLWHQVSLTLKKNYLSRKHKLY